MKTSRIDALIMEQEKLNTLSREAIEAVQLNKLNSLLRREHERGGFYKDLPLRLDSLEQLKALPFTTDAQLAEKGGAMLLVSQGQVQRVLSDATSGTTGAAKRVFYTLGDCENTVRLFTAGLGELIFSGSRTMICMPFSGEYGLGELISEAVRRLGAEPLKLGVNLSYGQLKAAMDEYRPDSYVGFPTALLSMLRVCGRGSLQRALISGDACPKSVTDAIESLLGSRVFPHYGSREMGLAGAVCCPAHEGMHLRENIVIAEIIGDKGEALPKGEYGELAITTIGMEAQPLIRYRTGDRTRIIPEPCLCGSAVLRLDAVGRKGGEELLALDEALFALPDMVDYHAERAGGKLHILALTADEPDVSSISKAAAGAVVEARKIRLTDKPLYMGKRTITG